MSNELTRRQMIGRAGLALGGVVGIGVLQACGGADAAPAPGGTTGGTNSDQQAGDGTATGPTPAQFPYEQHLAAGYRLDRAPIMEAAYHAYFAGGCCHGSYSSLLGHLASTAGAPFNQLPLDFGKFGGGGIASYGSICGAVLGGVLIINSIVANATARAAMMTDLMRWYERTAFPMYAPAQADAGEAKKTLDFSAANLPRLQVIPGSHLCHASVSSWCAANHVSATGDDKKARCARLTADVSGKTADMLNGYLAASAYAAAPLDTTSNGCVGCHGAASPAQPVASGMACTSCHPDKAANHP